MLTGLWLAASLSGVLDLSDRTEYRLRDPGDVPSTVAMDLETAGDARLTLASRRGHVSISYLPRLTLWDLNVDLQPPVLLQGGDVYAEWHNRFEQWWVDQQASYGGTNLTALSYAQTPTGTAPPNGSATPGGPTNPGGPATPGGQTVSGGSTGTTTPRVDAVPASRVIDYMSWSSQIGTRVVMRKWAFDWMVGYQLSGGAGGQDRTVLPLQYGPIAEGRVDFGPTRRSHYVTTVTGEQAGFSSGAESTLVEEEETWRYALRPSTTLELTGGAAEARVRPIEVFRYAHLLYPVAEVAVDEAHASKVGDRWVARVNVRMAPVINRLFGTVDERLEATLRGTWARQQTQVNAYLTAQQTVESHDANAVQLIYAEVSGSTPTKRSSTVAFDVGTRVTAQRLNTTVSPGSSDFTQASFVQGIVFVGLSFRAPPIRL